SLYNAGKGLQFAVEFTPLPVTSDKKARKNAKAKTIKKLFFVHEDSELRHMLYAALAALSREDLSFSCIPRSDSYTSLSLDIPGPFQRITPSETWSTCNADYEIMMITEACKKTDPPTIKITLSEMKPHEAGDEEYHHQSSDDKAPQKKKKKTKTYEPSEEEIEQAEIIVKLNAEWKCEDRHCKRSPCFPDRETGKHVHLTHFHLQTWAAAI
ncbi:hypothetical protein C8J57DRAFT_1069093, partial [Mycena rebaudengoi]